MAAGLKVWDASGNLIVDTSTRLTRILGYTTLAASSSNSVTDDGFYTGTPFYVAHRTNSAGGSYDAATSQISVSFSGNVMSLSTINPVANYIIMYGVY